MKNKKGIISITLYYPAIFLKLKKGGYEIFFPDFENSATFGSNIPDAMYMATDYIGAVLHDDILKGNELKEPSDPSSINMEKFLKENDLDDESLKEFAREKGLNEEYAEHIMEESFVTLVPFNPIKYLKNVEQRTVRRNVTLPYWMNEAARNLDINFSKTLQEAIMNKLNIDEDEE